MCDSTHMSGSPPDINMQSAKEALFKMFTDQSTEKKKKYIYIYMILSAKKGLYLKPIAGKKKTGNQTLNVEMLVTA